MNNHFHFFYTPINTHTLMQFSNEAPSREDLDFPGGKVNFIPKLTFTSKTIEERAHCYRVLNENGNIIMNSDSVQVNTKT